MNCGLLGRKLGHSYSPQIHENLGDYSYTLFEQEPGEVKDFLENSDFDGINVTIPYKKDVMPYCHYLSDTAQKIGAVNTIVRRNGQLLGHNTDYFGFSSMVTRSGLMVGGKKVLVLGSGGASVTAQAVLKEMGAKVVVISRSGENNYDNLELHKDACCIVNCTPVGMYPNNGVAPVDLSLFPALEGVLDMIYNPAKTTLLLDAEKRGLVTMNGLWMLVAQAKESAEWFLNRKLSDDLIEEIHNKLEVQMKNIVLIGMPGCGKTTVAECLSRMLAREVLDSDRLIEEMAGCPIPEIFEKYGEAGFRTYETEVLEKLGKLSGKVISTGGGCVTMEANLDVLHQNSIVVWLQRELANLPTEGRPLSKQLGVGEIFRIREPMYRKFAHIIVDNNGDPNDTAKAIIAQLK